jgi:hypothetical protein
VTVPLVEGYLTTSLRATNDPDLTPTGWVYHVVIDVVGSVREQFDLTVPYDTVGVIELPSVSPAGVGDVYVPAPTADDYFAFSLMMGGL